MTDKKSFILYLDQQELFNKLPDDIAGKLIKHIFSYVNCENPETEDLVLDIAFEAIKQALKRDLKLWEGKRKQRSNAGKKSAESRANKKQREPTESTSVESRSTKSTVSVNDSVSVSVNVSDKEEEIYTSSPKVSDPVPFVKIVDLYHTILPEMPNVEKLTDTRKGYIRQRWLQDLKELSHWENYFNYVRQSDFLMGKSQPNGDRRPFRCSLEWLTKPANFAKVSEDNYHHE